MDELYVPETFCPLIKDRCRTDCMWKVNSSDNKLAVCAASQIAVNGTAMVSNGYFDPTDRSKTKTVHIGGAR